MQKKHLYIYTIGCQMNVYDSDRIAESLAALGYQRTARLDRADLILVNTCTIRAKAEQKAFSFLGRLTDLKARKTGLIIGVAGCVAQQEGRKILQRMPHVDLVLGTQAIDRLPQIVASIAERRCRIVDVEAAPETPEMLPLEPPAPVVERKVARFVTIMRGCDNYCTYCVVPYVRGRETSREPDRILQEIRALVAAGVREVTLLGQNVNSYGLKEGLGTFPGLLAQVDGVEGLARIRFTTSHPKDLSEELMAAFTTLPKLCPHIHLPVQSGSSRILKRMNRRYTREDYLAKVERLRALCPSIAITTDIIAGFPGETEADFAATLDLLETVAFDNIFAFNYSDRPSAPASHFKNKVPAAESNRRLKVLLDRQARISRRKNEALVGSLQEVLVEGLSKQANRSSGKSPVDGPQWSGRTACNRIVNFSGPSREAGARPRIGDRVAVRIERALAHSLQGRLAADEGGARVPKGDTCYAA